MIGVYIHIPFCRTRCPYCDFVSGAVCGPIPESFVDALCGEIADFAGQDKVQSVFLGGGTPSLLSASQVGVILKTVAERFDLAEDAEISIEANPDDVDSEKCASWLEAGVNRVSLGVQSFNDEVLAYLGRRHDASAAIKACESVAKTFDNWSMDLIFGVGTAKQWRETLEQCTSLGPKHVSAYNLTYEESTPFWERRADVVDDDVSLELYRQSHESLLDYDHYEISNFALPSYACKHNLIYWHNDEYAGFGPGAYSFLDGVRSRNLCDTDAYLAAPGKKMETLGLSRDEIKVETVIQHMRLRDGMTVDQYDSRFGTLVYEDFGEQIEALVSKGLVLVYSGRIRPTRKGFELNNEIGLAMVD